MFLIKFIDQLLALYVYIIIIRAIMSWFAPRYDNPFYRVLIIITEPVLMHIRKIIPNLGGIDISPIVLILLIGLVRNYFFRM